LIDRIKMTYSPLDELKLDGTDNEKTLNTYTALTVKAIHEALHGKKGLVDRVSFLEKKYWIFMGGFAVIVFVIEIIFQS